MIFGYLDAGSGSLILQAVIGGLAGLGVAFKAMRMRLSRRGAPEVATAEGGAEVADEGALTAEP